jgi:hypothetical protein
VENFIMPLTSSVDRKLAHTRVVTCHGFKREDELWDIEGRIVDTKPYRFANRDRGGWIEADEALHDISIRITINIDMEVIDAEAVIDSSPYNYCKSVVTMAKNLVGLKIAPGWTLKSKAAMGKSRGCTHLTELLGPVATTAIQTISSEVMERSEEVSDDRDQSTSLFINSCHSLSVDSPVVKEHWPEQYQPAKK